MAGGYMGKILFIDLSNRSIETEEYDEDFARSYIGGYGFGSKIMYERMKPGADPLGENNMFGIGAGPLTGAPLPVVSRYSVMGKSPLTNSWGDANGSGFFGGRIRPHENETKRDPNEPKPQSPLQRTHTSPHLPSLSRPLLRVVSPTAWVGQRILAQVSEKSRKVADSSSHPRGDNRVTGAKAFLSRADWSIIRSLEPRSNP